MEDTPGLPGTTGPPRGGERLQHPHQTGRAGDAGAALPPTSRSDSTEASSPLPLLFCSDRQGGFRGQWQVNYFTYGVLVRTGKERPGVTGCECGLRAYLASNTELS